MLRIRAGPTPSRKLPLFDAVVRQHHYNADVPPQDICRDYGDVQGEPILHFSRAVLAPRVDEEDASVDLVEFNPGKQPVERIRNRL
jgi:hypothetical protein